MATKQKTGLSKKQVLKKLGMTEEEVLQDIEETLTMSKRELRKKYAHLQPKIKAALKRMKTPDQLYDIYLAKQAVKELPKKTKRR
jgi:hypothetical protein